MSGESCNWKELMQNIWPWIGFHVVFHMVYSNKFLLKLQSQSLYTMIHEDIVIFVSIYNIWHVNMS